MSGGKGKWALLGGRRTVVGGVVAHGILGRCGGSGGGGTHIAGVCGRGEMLPGILQKGAGSHNRRQLSHLLSLLFDPLVLSTTATAAAATIQLVTWICSTFVIFFYASRSSILLCPTTPPIAARVY